MSSMDTKTAVEEKYGAAARAVWESGSVACCDPGLKCCESITTNLYDETQNERAAGKRGAGVAWLRQSDGAD